MTSGPRSAGVRSLSSALTRQNAFVTQPCPVSCPVAAAMTTVRWPGQCAARYGAISKRAHPAPHLATGVHPDRPIPRHEEYQ